MPPDNETHLSAEFAAEHALEREKLDFEREKFAYERDRPWYSASIPWLGPTLGAVVAIVTVVMSNNAAREEMAEQRAAENAAILEQREVESQRQKAQAAALEAQAVFDRETEIILQATRSPDVETNLRNLQFFLEADLLEDSAALRSAMEKYGAPTDTGGVRVVQQSVQVCGPEKFTKLDSYSLRNHRLEGAGYCESPNKSDRPLTGGTPKFVVVHFTASPSALSTASVYMSERFPASSHFVIARDGGVAQFGNTNEVMWHAGTSTWKGIRGLNSHSVGIDLVNWGVLNRTAQDSVFKSYLGAELTGDEVLEAPHSNNPDKVMAWQRYTDAQFETIVGLGKALMAEYGLTPGDFVRHSDISPGRKLDPGPAFDFDEFRRRLAE